MATAGKLQDDFLTCSVFMEVFVQPVTLACQHTFCKNCLGTYLQTKEEAVRNKTIPCPTCRQETPVPHPDRPVEDWAGQLKPGLLLTGLMDSVLKGHDQCSVCKEEGKTTQAKHWCSECEALFCDGCLQMHSKMPILRKHKVVPVSDKKPRQKGFICKEHDEKVKLYCTDHDKPLCTVCCSIAHRTCKEVITINEQLSKVKSKLHHHQQNLADKINLTEVEVHKLDVQEKTLLANGSKLESEIRKTIQEAIDALKQQENQLIRQVKDQTEQDTQMLRSMMKTNQMDLQLYQQQSQSIQQAPGLEGEAQLFEMYLSSEADVTGMQRKDKGKRKIKDLANMKLVHNLENLEKEIRMIGVKIQHTDKIDLTATPVLDEVIEAKDNVGDSFIVKDSLIIMCTDDTKVTLFACYYTCLLKSFYAKEGQSCSSVLKMSGDPWCMTVISEGEVAVSLYNSPCFIRVAVTPDLALLSTIQTSKKYRGLSTLDQSTLVAGSNNPPSVDLIDMQGNILKTFTTLPTIGRSFKDPHYIHVTRQGTILVSDAGLKSVICLTQSGDIVFTYTPTGDRALSYPWGITTTSTEDILVADSNTHKVIQMSNTGEYIRDILTEENGVQDPTGLYVDGDKLCVTMYYKGLHKYRFG